MEYFENKLTIEDYIFLRSAVGWNNFETDQMAKVVQNSLYAVTVVEENQTIAMGRLLGDGMYYLVVDVVVEPEYQKRGIGSQIMDMLLKYAEGDGYERNICNTGSRAIIVKQIEGEEYILVQDRKDKRKNDNKENAIYGI